MAQLNIRKDNCELDFLSLGALVHRLTFLAVNTTSRRTCRIALV
jgi:hypothetical protein